MNEFLIVWQKTSNKTNKITELMKIFVYCTKKESNEMAFAKNGNFSIVWKNIEFMKIWFFFVPKNNKTKLRSQNTEGMKILVCLKNTEFMKILELSSKKLKKNIFYPKTIKKSRLQKNLLLCLKIFKYLFEWYGIYENLRIVYKKKN